ncbi:hypothetical protein CTAYLR_001263 [Chrysophaeum taylorii]|uniref:SAM-dependent MTase RsmB/NOP-type domain-containing protein n=1 Tax=Chrysophaeum taylorii TaxID=2483200 RepID=A0AAD7XI90_9STRA|nr:hypothetical protein CTAYLR_001263 [Chrysophaeum taylorii]
MRLVAVILAVAEALSAVTPSFDSSKSVKLAIKTAARVLDEGIDAEKAVRASLRRAESARGARRRVAVGVLGMTVWRRRLEAISVAAFGEATPNVMLACFWLCVKRDVVEASRYVGSWGLARLVAAAPLWYITRRTLPNEVFAAIRDSLGPREARSYGRACDRPGPTTLRLNRPFDDPALRLRPLSTRGAVRVEWRGRSLRSTEAWRNGGFEVQAESSQCAALATRARPGQRILDCCAGRGGKTLALLAMGARVAPDDTDLDALRQIPASARRANAADRLESPARGDFDVVLVDAPCSSTGVLRRHPSLRWQLDHRPWENLPQTQLDILLEASDRLKTGGILVYATCSVLRAENLGVTRKFEDLRSDDFAPLPFDEDEDPAFGWRPRAHRDVANRALARSLGIRTKGRKSRASDSDDDPRLLRPHELLFLPQVHGDTFDGFFIARFVRRSLHPACASSSEDQEEEEEEEEVAAAAG